MTAREEIAAQLESLALHAGTSELGDACDLLNYIATTIRTGAEGPIIEVLELVTGKAIKRMRQRDREEDRPLPPEDLGPYCKECGNDDRERLACVDNYANGTRWRCEVCGHEFMTGPKPREE